MNEKLATIGIRAVKELNEIPKELSRLSDSLDNLEKSIKELNGRLMTVTSIATPEIEDKSNFPELDSVLGTEILRLFLVSESCKESITDILRRLKI